MDSEPKQKRGSPLVLVLIIIIVLLAAVAVVLAMGKFGGDQKPNAENAGENGTPLLGYEEGVTALDGDALQQAVDEAYAEAAKQGVAMEYQNDATSKDGYKVECYIGNPDFSGYDVYLQVFADAEMTEQLYLSRLIPPGKALREMNLEKKLQAGKHRVVLVYTQVEDDHATLYQQAAVTLDITVEE